MRRIAWGLLLLFVFAIPWEYSLDLGAPLGNVARIVGVLLLLLALPAILQAGRLRTPGPLQWVVLAFYLWLCCSYFWTIDQTATLEKMRAYFQEMMIVWLMWEFAESPEDLRHILRAFVAGSWVLALLTLANFGSAEAIAAGQIRFAAAGLPAYLLRDICLSDWLPWYLPPRAVAFWPPWRRWWVVAFYWLVAIRADCLLGYHRFRFSLPSFGPLSLMRFLSVWHRFLSNLEAAT